MTANAHRKKRCHGHCRHEEEDHLGSGQSGQRVGNPGDERSTQARADVQEMMCGVRRNNTGSVREGGAALLLPNGTIDVTCIGACSATLAEHTISLTWNTAKLDDRQNDADLTQTISVPVTP